jgi:hypothetical protein
LNAATGNEVAYELDYTTNKATSGNDTGLLINMTDTASPGTSLPLEIKVGGTSKFSVDNTGKITGDGSGLSNISGAISGLTTGMILKAGSSSTLASSIIKESSSKIGIGTGANSIGYKLQVGGGDGSLNITEINTLLTEAGPAGMSVRNSSSNIEGTFYVNNSACETGTITNHPFNFYTNNSQRMTILGNGTVGINTSSPGARLDVTDTGTTTSAIIVPRAGNFTGTAVNGMIRYNTSSTLFEFRQNGAWVNYTTVSDGRLKTHVTPVTSGLSIVNQLNPVFYDWNRNNPKAASFEDKHQVGFIAQEVETVLPEVVNKGEDGYLSLEYGKVVSVVVVAVKELYKIALDLEARDAEQDRRIASKAAQTDLEALKSENSLLKVENARLSKEMEEAKARLDRIERMLEKNKVLPVSEAAQ